MFGIAVFRPYRAEPAPNPIRERLPLAVWILPRCGAKRMNKMPPRGKSLVGWAKAPLGTFIVDAKLSGAVPIMDTLMGTALRYALREKLPLRRAALPAAVFPDAPLRNPETLFFRYVEKLHEDPIVGRQPATTASGIRFRPDRVWEEEPFSTHKSGHRDGLPPHGERKPTHVVAHIILIFPIPECYNIV